MDRAEQTYLHPEKSLNSQAQRIVRFVGLTHPDGELRAITTLYCVLRTDVIPGAEYHHGQMSDERLFAEALRMLNYPDQLEKVIETYHNLSMF